MTIRHLTESDAITAAERQEWREWHGIDHNDDPDYCEPETDGEEEGEADE